MSRERDERRCFPTDRELSRMALAEEGFLVEPKWANVPKDVAARQLKTYEAITAEYDNPTDPATRHALWGNENFHTDNPHD